MLLVLWFLSIIGLGILGIQQATEQAYDGEAIEETSLPVRMGDTLRLAMRADTQYEYTVRRSGGVEIKYTENEDKIIYSNDIRLIVRSINDSIGKIVISKTAEGKNLLEAKQRAEAIDYNYTMENNSLTLDGYFLTNIENKYRNQEVEIILYLPIGTVVYADENTYSFHRNNSNYRDILNNGDESHYIRILENKTECLDCPLNQDNTWESESNSDNGNWEEELEEKLNDDDTSHKIIIDKDGVKINPPIEKDTTQTKTGN
jgi:hypothetical protein